MKLASCNDNGSGNGSVLDLDIDTSARLGHFCPRGEQPWFIRKPEPKMQISRTDPFPMHSQTSRAVDLLVSIFLRGQCTSVPL